MSIDPFSRPRATRLLSSQSRRGPVSPSEANFGGGGLKALGVFRVPWYDEIAPETRLADDGDRLVEDFLAVTDGAEATLLRDPLDCLAQRAEESGALIA